MRWIRLLLNLTSATFRRKLLINDNSVINFGVWLTDVDATIMNHASILTVFECGRLDYTVRVGFFKLARKKKWIFPLVAQSVQYLRPLKLFQKAKLITRVFHVSEDAIYTEQKIVRHGKIVAICISKTKVKSGKENISPLLIARELDAGELPSEFPELIKSFDEEKALFKDWFTSAPDLAERRVKNN